MIENCTSIEVEWCVESRSEDRSVLEFRRDGWLMRCGMGRERTEVEWCGGRARLTGKNEFVVEAGLNVERCRPRFIV